MKACKSVQPVVKMYVLSLPAIVSHLCAEILRAAALHDMPGFH
jgi:hypothetical protein